HGAPLVGFHTQEVATIPTCARAEHIFVIQRVATVGKIRKCAVHDFFGAITTEGNRRTATWSRGVKRTVVQCTVGRPYLVIESVQSHPRNGCADQLPHFCTTQEIDFMPWSKLLMVVSLQ